MERKCIILLIAFCAVFMSGANAQSTLYFMDRLPQSQQFNPAFIPKMNFYLSLPVIGSSQVEVNNSGFNLGQFLDFSDNLDNSNYDPDEFIRSIGDFNQTTMELRMNLLSFGFKLKKDAFLSMGLCNRNIIDVTAPAEMVYLLDEFDKIRNRLPLRIDGMNMKMNSFSQLSVTFAKSLTEKLTVGITPKLIGAWGGISSERLNLEVEEVEEREYETTFDGKVWVGLPIPINPLAVKQNGELDTDQDILEEDWAENFSAGNLFQDPSLAIDLGVNYQLNRQWSFSASLIDIGKSSWKKHAYYLTYDGETSRVEDDQKLKLKIPAKLFVGANYVLSPSWNAGLLYRNVFYESGSSQSATLSLNGYIGRMLSTSFTYTAAKRFDNLGFGLRLRFLPGTDLFLVTDNILHAINYKNIQYSTLAFGINLALGVRAHGDMATE
jgi:hypothetical protein